MNRKRWFVRALTALAGGTVGFLYYHYVGCMTGACPITSNPVLSVGYGALIGLVLAWNRPAGPPQDSSKDRA